MLKAVVSIFVVSTAPVPKEDVSILVSTTAVELKVVEAVPTVALICPPSDIGISTRCLVLFSTMKNIILTMFPASITLTLWVFKVLFIHWIASWAFWIASNTAPIFFHVSIVKDLEKAIVPALSLTEILISFPNTDVVKIYTLFFWVNWYEWTLDSIFI